MKKVEIQTTHNVYIEKSIANLGSRVGAWVIDFILLMILIAIISSLRNTFDFGETFYGIFLGLVFCLFNLIIEYIFNGRSFGKMLIGIRIVRMDGKDLTITELMSRWSLRFVDIYMSIGAVAATMISTSLYGQRLGDLIANTLVVKDKYSGLYTLEEISKLRNNNGYVPEYAGVTRLIDADILIIKKVLKRSKQVPSKGNMLALYEAGEKVAETIGLEKTPKDSRKFLQTIIVDYIALTR